MHLLGYAKSPAVTVAPDCRPFSAGRGRIVIAYAACYAQRTAAPEFDLGGRGNN